MKIKRIALYQEKGKLTERGSIVIDDKLSREKKEKRDEILMTIAVSILIVPLIPVFWVIWSIFLVAWALRLGFDWLVKKLN